MGLRMGLRKFLRRRSVDNLVRKLYAARSASVGAALRKLLPRLRRFLHSFLCWASRLPFNAYVVSLYLFEK